MNDFNFQDQIVFVTGAARGIGNAIASAFLECGAKVVAADLLEVETALSEAHRDNVLPLVGDLTDKANVTSFVQQSVEKFGRIDVLVNNAGVVRLDPAESLSKEDWDLTLEVNLTAPFVLTQEVGKQMIAQQGGKIVNIASQAAEIALGSARGLLREQGGADGDDEGVGARVGGTQHQRERRRSLPSS